MNTQKQFSLAALAALSLALCSAAYAEQNSNEILIEAPVQKVYDYVSQPHRWHEWHPASLSADTANVGALKQGDRFSEKIRIYGQETEMSYQVLIASPPYEFKTAFTSALIDGTIHYRLEQRSDGTLFHRTLDYSIDKYIATLKSGMLGLSKVALGNLKGTLETAP